MWPTVDSAHEEEVRRRLSDVLVRGLTPDQRTAALVALLHAVGRAHKVVAAEGLPAGAVKARAKEIAEGAWAAQAVKDADRRARHRGDHRRGGGHDGHHRGRFLIS